VNQSRRRLAARIAATLLAVAAAGCSTIDAARGGPGARLDPWEQWNRKVFNFNDDLDRTVFIPATQVYNEVVPQPIRVGVANFYNNFSDAWSAVNNLLMLRFEASIEDATRVGANTVFGLFGVLDVASEMGLDHHYQDFGNTLARYGVGAGAYVVLPVLGPSTVRETAALPLNRYGTPPAYFQGTWTQVGLLAVEIVNTRSSLLGASRVIDDIALDKYTFIRDAYLQRRGALVFDSDASDAPPAPDGAASSTSGATEAPAASAPDAAASAPATAGSAPAR
jgi:phospholipid-binding lipoprotein MlaA